MRRTILLVVFVLVIVAPMVGVYAFSPVFFVWGLEPYQLAVTLAVMLAEAIAIAVFFFLVVRARKP